MLIMFWRGSCHILIASIVCIADRARGGIGGCRSTGHLVRLLKGGKRGSEGQHFDGSAGGRDCECVGSLSHSGVVLLLRGRVGVGWRKGARLASSISAECGGLHRRWGCASP